MRQEEEYTRFIDDEKVNLVFSDDPDDREGEFRLETFGNG